MSETLRDRRLRYARMILQSRRSASALLGETSDLEGQRVLVLGTSSAATLAALIHTECRKAEIRTPELETERRSADLVLVPSISLQTMARVVEQAARALDSYGRIVIAVPQNERDFVAVTSRALIAAGFDTPFLQSEAGETRMYAARGPLLARA